MRLSLRSRIFLGVLAVVVLTVLGLGIPLLRVVRDRSLDEIETSLKGNAFQGATLMTEGLRVGDHRLVESLAERVAVQSGARVTVTDAGGQLVYDSSDPGRELEDFTNRPEIQAALEGRATVETRRSETLNADLLVVAVPSAAGGRVYGVVRLSRDLAAVRSAQMRVSLGVGLILLLVLAAGVWVASVISRSVTRPADGISAMAEKLGMGDLSVRVAEIGPPELRRLARSLNDSASRVEAAVATERSFLGNAAHQLRTPLTAMAIRLDTLSASRALTDGERRDLSEAQTELWRLAHLIDQLLVLSRTSERGAMLLEQPVDVRPAMASVAATWRERMADAGIDLDVTIDNPLPPVAVPPQLLAEAAENLLDNVVLYCPESDRAFFGIRRVDSCIEMVVSDSGLGIPRNLADRVFERFERGASKQSGSGLGLAVVRQVAEAAGGHAELSTSPSGTTFTVTIPVAGVPSAPVSE